MSLVAFFGVADTHASLIAHHPLDTTQQITWELHFLDIPTGEREVLCFTSENFACQCFAAFIAADETEAAWFANASYYLRHNLQSTKFLP